MMFDFIAWKCAVHETMDHIWHAPSTKNSKAKDTSNIASHAFCFVVSKKLFEGNRQALTGDLKQGYKKSRWQYYSLKR